MSTTSRNTRHDASRTHAVEERSGWVPIPRRGTPARCCSGKESMSPITSLRRAGAALVAPALAATLVATAVPAHAVSTTSPAGQGAGWLAGQLNAQGLIHNRQFGFDDYGLTIDTALALDAIGGHQKDVVRARRALAKHVNSYT